MNNMTRELINEGSENKRVKMNVMGIKTGALLLVIAFLSLLTGVLVPPSMENHMALIFDISLAGALITFLVVGVKNIVNLMKKRER